MPKDHPEAFLIGPVPHMAPYIGAVPTGPKRPGITTVGGAMAITGGLACIGSALMVLDPSFRESQAGSTDEAMIIGAMLVGFGTLIFGCGIAVLMRQFWAAIVLTVSAVLFTIPALVGVSSAPLSLLCIGWAVLGSALLILPRSRAWLQGH